MFPFTAETLIKAFRAHAPEVLPSVQEAVAQAQADLGFTRLAEGPWQGVPDISIDYAILERARNLAVMSCGAGWSDQRHNMTHDTATVDLSRAFRPGLSASRYQRSVIHRTKILVAEFGGGQRLRVGIALGAWVASQGDARQLGAWPLAPLSCAILNDEGFRAARLPL